jgi:hypothetical protein
VYRGIVDDVGVFLGGTVSPYVAEIYFNFFFKQCKIGFGAKYIEAITSHVTVSHVKQEEALLLTGQIVFPNGAKTPYIGNQEMSDESRNGL